MADTGPTVRATPVVLDNTINLPFLLAVIGAILAGASWATRSDERLARLEEQMHTLSDMRDRLVRMEARLESQSAPIRQSGQVSPTSGPAPSGRDISGP